MIIKCPKCDSENVAPIYYGIQHDNNEIRELIDTSLFVKELWKFVFNVA